MSIRNGLKNRTPLDYIMKNDLENCYLTIHNFISLNTTLEYNKTIENENWNLTNNEHFHTYITSFTKPYLIELINNNTKDCLCC